MKPEMVEMARVMGYGNYFASGTALFLVGLMALVVRLNLNKISLRSQDAACRSRWYSHSHCTDTRQPLARTASARAGLPCAKHGVGAVSDFGADETM